MRPVDKYDERNNSQRALAPSERKVMATSADNRAQQPLLEADHGPDGGSGNATARTADLPADRCPRCGVYTKVEYIICPYCSLPLKKECPSCHTYIPINWKACSFCGQVLQPLVFPDPPRLMMELPSSSGALPVQVTVHGKVVLRGRCPECSRLILDDARYCDSCGWKIVDSRLKPITRERGPSSGSL